MKFRYDTHHIQIWHDLTKYRITDTACWNVDTTAHDMTRDMTPECQLAQAGWVSGERGGDQCRQHRHVSPVHAARGDQVSTHVYLTRVTWCWCSDGHLDVGLQCHQQQQQQPCEMRPSPATSSIRWANCSALSSLSSSSFNWMYCPNFMSDLTIFGIGYILKSHVIVSFVPDTIHSSCHSPTSVSEHKNETKWNKISQPTKGSWYNFPCLPVSKPRRTSYLLVVPVVLLASWLPHLVCTLIFIHQQVMKVYLIYVWNKI